MTETNAPCFTFASQTGPVAASPAWMHIGDLGYQYQFKTSQGPAAIITAPSVPPTHVTQITIAGTILGSSA